MIYHVIYRVIYHIIYHSNNQRSLKDPLKFQFPNSFRISIPMSSVAYVIQALFQFPKMTKFLNHRYNAIRS